MTITSTELLTFLAVVIVPIVVGLFDYKRKKAEISKLSSDVETSRLKLSESAVNTASLSIIAQAEQQKQIDGLRQTVNQMAYLVGEIPTLKEKVLSLERERSTLIVCIKNLEAGVSELITQLHTLGVTPVWMPIYK